LNFVTSTTTATATATPSANTLPCETCTAHSMNFGWVVLAVLGAFVLGRLLQFMKDVGRGIGPRHGGGGK
jgi:hypothetical protein